jgi:hypothetical protein
VAGEAVFAMERVERSDFLRHRLDEAVKIRIDLPITTTVQSVMRQGR